MSHTVNDRRGTNVRELEVCRFCGSKTVHTRSYSDPTTDCAKFLRERVRELEAAQVPQPDAA